MKVGIAMSGGVDSTACALLLREKYEVEGFFMRLAQPAYDDQKKGVEELASALGINLHIIDLHHQFSQKVLDYFTATYFRGHTPNPCVICNREIKFGLFLETILDHGMDRMATGHYARIECNENRCRLFAGDDCEKDQSYFLSRLDQRQLNSILFPLGSMTKESIYRYVEQQGFHGFRGKESQDVCFLENNRITDFLESRNPAQTGSGPIVTGSGEELGVHRGLHCYTIGQRRGLGISSDSPLYVIRLDTATNSVVVGKNDELFKTSVTVKEVHWLAGSAPSANKKYKVRIRYSHRGSLAQLSLLDNNRARFVFDQQQRAVTPGQFAVVYDGSELLGSGIIE
ncbi:tRNA 2-thiouridine(34) synthase MnmA [Desulforhopalus singaporensis]|uniref:tRNA-specific 2-thiouridylase MnmA n=1 Tax=Desulforhopalus singaporensis TaxID=91360 RepID=A0A1H0UBX3_9BACT|nr:tRNA 2-thiouridine(34) synthase MnmA [Desulforhopalus singaporensis]SDP63346.1 tRNA (5-methylaminomethyl-2-thiouridylate)-methyltransferase [Desulforhopalus singaporensis]